jgi:plasmid stabilization system protein ParE
MPKVLFAPPARAFVEQEILYLRDRSPAAAIAFRAGIAHLGRQLARFPQSGFLRQDIPLGGIYRIVLGDYRVDYELAGDERPRPAHTPWPPGGARPAARRRCGLRGAVSDFRGRSCVFARRAYISRAT